MKALRHAWLRLICFVFGHWHGSWFKTVSGACSQHPLSDGVQCYRCDHLIGTYDRQDNFARNAKYVRAPRPIYDV